ncbi:MAG: hypothetical protein HYW26_01635 [Candidatus Aenigmarchaeota archaeon]|nr:hypothetical protein [Candidatus Aenigmarchaeota archaeon]
MDGEKSAAQKVAPQLIRDVFGVGTSCPGCGEQLGLKIALQALGRCILVNSNGSVSLLAKYPRTSFNVPFVNCGMNAAAAASAIARAQNRPEVKNPEKVVVYAGDAATSMHLGDVIAAADRGDNVIYICYNNKGSGSVNHASRVEKSITKSVALSCAYAATASMAFPDDYAAKLAKSAAMSGFKFIEVLTPCPVSWSFDPSITVEVARLAVETGVWPVFEVENKKVSLTRRPLRLEPVEKYISLQKRFSFSEEEMTAVQEAVKKNYRMLSEGKLA